MIVLQTLRDLVKRMLIPLLLLATPMLVTPLVLVLKEPMDTWQLKLVCIFIFLISFSYIYIYFFSSSFAYCIPCRPNYHHHIEHLGCSQRRYRHWRVQQCHHHRHTCCLHWCRTKQYVSPLSSLSLPSLSPLSSVLTRRRKYHNSHPLKLLRQGDRPVPLRCFYPSWHHQLLPVPRHPRYSQLPLSPPLSPLPSPLSPLPLSLSPSLPLSLSPSLPLSLSPSLPLSLSPLSPSLSLSPLPLPLPSPLSLLPSPFSPNVVAASSATTVAFSAFVVVASLVALLF